MRMESAVSGRKQTPNRKQEGRVERVRRLKRLAIMIDSVFENVAISALLAMTLIVVVQVVTRKLWHHVFFWSEEITLLLLVWFSFMGMAVGVRERLHLAVTTVADRLPAVLRRWLDRLIALSTLAFGLYLVKYGWQFAEMQRDVTLAATKWPNSVLYAVMPIAGAMVAVYALLQLFGVDTVRHRDEDGEGTPLE
mgnify:FL=1